MCAHLSIKLNKIKEKTTSQQRWFSERLFPRIPKGQLELCQTVPKSFIIDIRKDPDSSEVADIHYYKGVPLSLTWNLSAANVWRFMVKLVIFFVKSVEGDSRPSPVPLVTHLF